MPITRQRLDGIVRVVIASVALVLIAGSNVSAETIQLSLYTAIERGMSSNEAYKSALAEETRAEQEIKRARAGILPKVDFDATYARAFKIPSVVIGGQTIEFGSKHTSIWGINWEQSIWEGGRVLAAWKAARNVGHLASAFSQQAGIELQSQVATAFFDAILTRRLVDVAQQSLDVAEANYEVARQKFDQGLVSEYDRLRSKVRVANMRPTLISAENRRDIAESRLRKLIGLESGVEIELVESVPDSAQWESRTVENLVDLAISRRPDLVAAQFEIAARENAVSIARADYYPSLRMSGTFNWQTYTDELTYRNEDITRSWEGRLTLSFPLFDGFRRAGNVGVSKVDLSQAHYRRQELIKQVSLDVESARHSFIEATQRLDAQEETVSEAQRGLDIANVRYESGVGTQLEVLAAQLDLMAARVNAETARHDRLVARVAWRRAMGEPVLNAISLVPEE